MVGKDEKETQSQLTTSQLFAVYYESILQLQKKVTLRQYRIEIVLVFPISPVK